jgi:Ca2+-binding RTX toxin-like protein
LKYSHEEETYGDYSKPHAGQTRLVGGFDTIVVGNGANLITAMAGVSTIVAGNGNNQITVGGSYNTIVAGDGHNHVVGVMVDHTSISAGNGGDVISLTGAGYNVVKTGAGNDVISLSGMGNWVDAGAATTFNAIYGGLGDDTFVLPTPGSGFDEIFNFDLRNGDRLDLRNVLAAKDLSGGPHELGKYLSTEIVGNDTLLEATSHGHETVVADLVGLHVSNSTLFDHGVLI